MKAASDSLVLTRKVVVIMISWMASSCVRAGGHGTIFVSSFTARTLAAPRGSAGAWPPDAGRMDPIPITTVVDNRRWRSSRRSGTDYDDGGSAGGGGGDSIWDGSGRRIRIRSTAADAAPGNRSSPSPRITKRKGNDGGWGSDAYGKDDDGPPRGGRRDYTDDDDVDDDGWGGPSPSRSRSNDGPRSSRGGGWDDFDPWSDDKRNERNDDRSAGVYPPRRGQGGKKPPPFPQRRGGGREGNFQDRRGTGNRRGGGDDGPSWTNDQPKSFDRRRNDGSFRPRPSQRGGDGVDKFDRRKATTTFNKRGEDKRNGRDKSERSINMNALEGAGFVHLYGISSVLNALTADRRDLQTNLERSHEGQDDKVSDTWGNDYNEDVDDADDDDDDEFDTQGDDRALRKVPAKPKAQFRPFLFLQERSFESGRRDSKASATQEILRLAKERQVSVEYVDKGILNTLSGNRPHQGMVLRCGKLYYEGLTRIPLPSVGKRGDDGDDDDSTNSSSSKAAPSLWLVLDEVVDPQNLGALLRSASFLGRGRVGILVCSKNSAPPSPIVSAASAGALELMEVHSTVSLPRTLNLAREDGFRIIGASSSPPPPQHNAIGGRSIVDEEDVERDVQGNGGTTTTPRSYDLHDLPRMGEGDDDRPILLVLGSEGHGLRTLVARACTEFVRIPSGMTMVGGQLSSATHGNDDDDGTDSVTTTTDGESQAGVDSLNVSVTGGIMLWHLLGGRNNLR
jgi:21S rRNA (GM2251-2'-O)-methyltransferase